jgi:hypothetical protein
MEICGEDSTILGAIFQQYQQKSMPKSLFLVTARAGSSKPLSMMKVP